MPSVETLDFNSIPDAIEAFKAGDFIVVLDSPSRENEGDLIISATALTEEKCAFMLRHTSGYMCVPMPRTLAGHLGLPAQVGAAENTDPNATAYTISVDANTPEITTGISAHDRALTCRMLGAKSAAKEHFRRPGHILPLLARDGGVRERAGHTEAAVEFGRLSGRGPVSVICELVDHGDEAAPGVPERKGAGMMRAPACIDFARRWNMKVVTIEDLKSWLGNETDGSNGA